MATERTPAPAPQREPTAPQPTPERIEKITPNTQTPGGGERRQDIEPIFRVPVEPPPPPNQR
jgi:hypothetical protein